MTLGGWINMVLSVGAVTFLFAWCIFQVLRPKKPHKNVHGFEIAFKDPESKKHRPPE
jgi:hypothetical protein